MSFKNYLKEVESLELLDSEKLINIINSVKLKKQRYDNEFIKKMRSVITIKPEKYERMDRVIKEINKFKHLKGRSLLFKFIDITKEYAYDNTEIIDILLNIYGSQVLDIYVSSDDDAPPFLKGIQYYSDKNNKKD